MSKTLLHAKKFIDKGNHKEALVLIENYEENEDHTPSEINLCHLLKCDILRQQGLYNDLLKLADQVFNECTNEKSNLHSIDALFYMTEALLRLFRFEEAYDKIKEAEELLVSLNQTSVEFERRKAYIDFLKGWYYYPNEEADIALDYLRKSLTIQQKLNLKQEISFTSALIAWIYGFYKMEMDIALEYGHKALKLAKGCKKKYYIAIILNVVAALYNLRGELEQSIELQEQSLNLFRELNNKSHTSTLLNNLGDIYRMKGDLDKALEYLEQSVNLSFELGYSKQAASNHDFLIKILVERGNLERANHHLKDMETLKNHLDNEEINILYLSNKAFILKTSSLRSDQIEAREILEDLVSRKKSIPFDVSVRNILNLCEIYLFEFQNTCNLELLDQIQLHIYQMIDIAKNQNLPILLVESYLLDVNLNLIKFDFKKIQDTLTEAQKVAKNYDMNQLSKRILKEKEYFIKQKDRLAKIERPYKDSTMIEFSEIAPLRTQINYMLKKRELFKSIKI